MITALQVHAPLVPQIIPVVVRHCSPPQQAAWVAQVWPAPAQVEAWQVPLPPPVAITQLFPVQQSAELVQTPFAG